MRFEWHYRAWLWLPIEVKLQSVRLWQIRRFLIKKSITLCKELTGPFLMESPSKSQALVKSWSLSWDLIENSKTRFKSQFDVKMRHGLVTYVWHDVNKVLRPRVSQVSEICKCARREECCEVAWQSQERVELISMIRAKLCLTKTHDLLLELSLTELLG